MDLLAKDHQEERIPSYEESVQQRATGRLSMDVADKSYVDQSSLLAQQISDVRSHNIDAIIKLYIDPLIRSQVTSGLLKSTFVLVPTDVDSLQRTNPALNVVTNIIEGFGDASSLDGLETVVGFPSETYVKLVRLHGAEFNSMFWRQEVVIKELESTLESRLRARGHEVVQLQSRTPQFHSSPAVAGPLIPKPRFLRWRTSGISQQRLSPTPITTSPSSWRFERDEILNPGHVRLKVGLREVCLRVKTEFGLYETRTGKAVVVNFEVGT